VLEFWLDLIISIQFRSLDQEAGVKLSVRTRDEEQIKLMEKNLYGYMSMAPIEDMAAA
jgi:hypothetical protein